jgi:hypothetical protein
MRIGPHAQSIDRGNTEFLSLIHELYTDLCSARVPLPLEQTCDPCLLFPERAIPKRCWVWELFLLSIVKTFTHCYTIDRVRMLACSARPGEPVMKKPRVKFIFLSVLILGGLLMVGYGVSQSNAQQPVMHNAFGTSVNIPPTATRMPGCVNYPVEKINNLKATATPGRGTLVKKQELVSVTSIPVASIIDLSPKTLPDEKVTITVFRCDGTYIQYLVDLNMKTPEDLHLQAGDTIIERSMKFLHYGQPRDFRKTMEIQMLSPHPTSPYNSIWQPDKSTPPPTWAPYPAQSTFGPYPVPNNTSVNNPNSDQAEPSNNPYPAP